jgi:D-3-phosphoglycerate dehydrogenase / 2-oxoglutarate reductase
MPDGIPDPKSQIRILVSEFAGFSTRAAALLRQIGYVVLADLKRSELLSAVGEADILWVRLRNRIDTEVMNAGRCLKVIVTPTTGLNHIDLEEAERRGIQILSLRGQTDFLQDVRATAEHTIALILALLRHLPTATTHTREGGWNRDLFKGRELYGKTVGIVGYGRLGRLVARYLTTFDTHVLTADPHMDSSAVEPGVALVPLLQLLREADLVTLHVNLSDKTQGFFGQQQFVAMKEGAWFINTSRGELVDEIALLNALQSGRVAGAALDVLGNEHSSGMQDHPLVGYARQYDNLIITPHIGGCTYESMEKTECFLADRLITLLKHEVSK